MILNIFAELKALREENAQLKAQIADWAKSSAYQRSEMTRLDEQNNKLAVMRYRLNDDNIMLKDVLLDANDRIAELEEQNEELSKIGARWADAYEAAHKQSMLKNERIKELEKDVDLLNDQINILIDDLNNMSESRDNYKETGYYISEFEDNSEELPF